MRKLVRDRVVLPGSRMGIVHDDDRTIFTENGERGEVTRVRASEVLDVTTIDSRQGTEI